MRPILELQARLVARSPPPDELLIERLKIARGASPLLLPVRGPAGARGAGGAVRLSDRPARPDHLHPRGRTTTGSSCSRAEPGAARRGARGRTALARPTCRTTSRRASTRPSWRGGSSARSRAWRASSSRAIPGAAKSREQLQASSELLYDVFARVRPGQPAAGPGPPRGAGAAARAEPARRALDAHRGRPDHGRRRGAADAARLPAAGRPRRASRSARRSWPTASAA